jgi:hypothetical protein
MVAVGRLRQEDHKFEASLGYIMRPCLKKKNRKITNYNVNFINHHKNLYKML